jgi:uncharacterized protein YerC
MKDRKLVNGTDGRVFLEVEYSCFYKMADVFVVTEIDGIEYRNIHVSGPKEDVMAYFDGMITMTELQKRWSISKEELHSSRK